MVKTVTRGALKSPTAACTDDVVTKLHVIIDRQHIGYTLDVVGGTKIGERPAFLFELLYQPTKIVYPPLA